MFQVLDIFFQTLGYLQMHNEIVLWVGTKAKHEIPFKVH